MYVVVCHPPVYVHDYIVGSIYQIYPDQDSANQKAISEKKRYPNRDFYVLGVIGKVEIVDPKYEVRPVV